MTTVAIPWSTASAKYLARLPAKQVWQAPAFVVGIVALAAALTAHPFLRNSSDQLIRRDLAEAYGLLDQTASDPNDIRRLADDVLAHRCTNEQSARAHFLLGIAYSRIAADSSGPIADQAFQRSRENLEEALPLGVPDRDQPRLHFALAQCYIHADEGPERVVTELEAGLPPGTDNAEGLALLAENYRRCKPANIDGALEAYSRLLNLPSVPESAFWTANLACGELLLQKKDSAGARRALERIKPPAPVKQVRKAHELLARTLEEEKQWSKATEQWKALLDHPSPQELGRILCHLGRCYREQDRVAEASAAWEESLQTASSKEEQAAALGLAELRLEANPTDAVAMFQRAVRNVNAPGDWNNCLVDCKDAQSRFELACQHCLDAHQFEAGLQIAQAYAKLGPPGKGHEIAAHIAEQWAQTLTGDEQDKTYRLAGGEHEAAAEAVSEQDKAEQMGAALQCYLDGHAATAAVRVLKQLAHTAQEPEKIGEGWYRLAALQLSSIPAGAAENEIGGHRDSALEAYRQCLNFPGKYQYRARYRLAHEKIAQGDFDGAIADLNTNLALLAVDMDREAHENSTFELADILFQRQSYRQALARLTQALDLYNDGKRAYPRYQVAECHRLLAEEAQNSLRETDRLPTQTQDYYRKQRQESYENAYKAYGELAELLSGDLSKDGSETEKSLYRASRFKEAECRFQAGDYKGALDVNQELSKLYMKQVERLHALAGKRRCLFAIGENDKATAVLDEIKQAIEALPEGSFTEPTSTWTRQKWVEWLETERRNDTQAGLRGAPRPSSSSGSR